MTSIDTLYDSIVADLVAAGAESAYSQDANEPDPRYLSYGVRMTGVKAIFKTHRPSIKPLDTDAKAALATRLIESRYGEQQTIALFVLDMVPRYFDPGRFDELDRLVSCVHGWSKIDSFCGSLLKRAIEQHPQQFLPFLERWNQDDDMWMRRASVVVFTRKVAKSGLHNDFALTCCDNLKYDPEDLVQKGVGWALKDLMRSDKARVVEYVKQLRADGVSSVITLYAIRDLKGAERKAVLDIRPK